MKKWICKKCNSKELEEVLPGVTLYSQIIGLDFEEDTIIFNYSNTQFDIQDGNIAKATYRCKTCGCNITKEELYKLKFNNV